MSESKSQSSDAKLQDNPQETPGNPPTKASAEIPTYTEAQLQEKIKEAQSKIRKGEATRYEKLENDYLELKAAKSALEGQIEDVEVLKAQIAELHELKTEGLPSEAKEYLKLKAQLKESEIRGSKDVKSIKERLETYEKKDKETLVDKLVTKLGIGKDTLTDFSIEHLRKLDTAEVTKPEAKAPETPATETVPAEKMPSPETGATQAGGGHSFRTQEERFAKGEISLAEYSAARKSEGLPS